LFADLSDDPDQTFTNAVYDNLVRQLDAKHPSSLIKVRRYPGSLPSDSDGTGNRTADQLFLEITNNARSILAATNTDLIIWGRVSSKDQSSILLHFLPRLQSALDRSVATYSFGKDMTLPTQFSDEVGHILTAQSLVTLASISQPGNYPVDLLKRTLEQLHPLVVKRAPNSSSMPGQSAEDLARLRFLYLFALSAYSIQSGIPLDLGEVNNIWSAAATETPSFATSKAKGIIEISLASSAAAQGDYGPQVKATLESGVLALRSAYDDDQLSGHFDPITQVMLGIGMVMHGLTDESARNQLQDGQHLIQTYINKTPSDDYDRTFLEPLVSLASLQSAIWQKDQSGLETAVIEVQGALNAQEARMPNAMKGLLEAALGEGLYLLGYESYNKKMIEEGMAHTKRALTYIPPDNMPIERGIVQQNLAMQLAWFAARDGDKDKLDVSISMLRNVVEEFVKIGAQTQIVEATLDLADVLIKRGTITFDKAMLQDALGYLRSSIKGLPTTASTVTRARASRQLGLVLYELGHHDHNEVAILEAIEAARISAQSLTSAPAESADRIDSSVSFGTMLASRGRETGDPILLREAQTILAPIVDKVRREADPKNWEKVHLAWGVVNFLLGARSSDDGMGQRAIDSLHLVVDGTANVAHSPYRQTAQLLLASALVAKSVNEPEQLKEAMNSISNALNELSIDKSPNEWANAQSLKGFVLIKIGETEKDDNSIDQGLVAARSALKVISRESEPWLWAHTQSILGFGLQRLGSRQKSEQLLLESRAALRMASAVFNQVSVSTDRALVNLMLCATIGELYEINADFSLLNDGLVACNDAALAYRNIGSPIEIQSAELGLFYLYKSLGLHQSQINNLNEAETAYRNALQHCNQNVDFQDWLETKKLLDKVIHSLALRDAKDGRSSRWWNERMKLQEEHVQIITKREISEFGRIGFRTAEEEFQLARDALFAQDFEKSLRASEQAMTVEPFRLLYLTNKAHALLHLGRDGEAIAIYMENRGKILGGRIPVSGIMVGLYDRTLWEDVIADDFKRLAKAGISHPRIPEIELMLKAKN